MIRPTVDLTDDELVASVESCIEEISRRRAEAEERAARLAEVERRVAPFAKARTGTDP